MTLLVLTLQGGAIFFFHVVRSKLVRPNSIQSNHNPCLSSQTGVEQDNVCIQEDGPSIFHKQYFCKYNTHLKICAFSKVDSLLWQSSTSESRSSAETLKSVLHKKPLDLRESKGTYFSTALPVIPPTIWHTQAHPTCVPDQLQINYALSHTHSRTNKHRWWGRALCVVLCDECVRTTKWCRNGKWESKRWQWRVWCYSRVSQMQRDCRTVTNWLAMQRTNAHTENRQQFSYTTEKLVLVL